MCCIASKHERIHWLIILIIIVSGVDAVSIKYSVNVKKLVYKDKGKRPYTLETSKIQ